MSTDEPEVDQIIRRAMGGDTLATAWIAEQAATSPIPSVVALAAILDGTSAPIDRALALAVTTRDRQVVAIAAAHLRGDNELVDALARDHLVDHPDSVLVAWIASGADGRGGPGHLP
ncbi:MAG TPA: hypothetical protein VIY72_13135 [Acidimicrobiales bacterium]